MFRRSMVVAAALVLVACSEGPMVPELEAPAALSGVADLAGPNDVTYGILHGTVRFWNTQVTAVSAGTFAGNAALVPPGASVTLTGTMQRGPATDMSYCPGCIIQTYVAWVPPAVANGASPTNQGIQSDQNTPWSFHGAINFTWTTAAPTVPGTYYVGEGETWDYVYQPWAQGSMGWMTGDPSTPAASFIIKVRGNPSTKDDCKNGGWEAYEFANQGQCVRYVETGKDSR